MSEPAHKVKPLVAKWRLMLLAARDPDITKADLAVLGAVLDRMGNEFTAWPSLSTIADDAVISNIRTVTRSIGRLDELGYLVRDSGREGRKVNRYEIGKGRGALARSAMDGNAPSATDIQSKSLGANDDKPLGAQVSKEFALKSNLKKQSGKERTKELPQGGLNSSKQEALTLSQWLAAKHGKGDAMPEATGYCAKIELPEKFRDLAWYEFRHRFKHESRSDWPERFVRFLREDWAKLWRIQNGEYIATTAGKQLAKELGCDDESSDYWSQVPADCV